MYHDKANYCDYIGRHRKLTTFAVNKNTVSLLKLNENEYNCNHQVNMT